MASSVVSPSTSKLPLASMLPVNVDRPVTLRFLVVMSSSITVLPPPAVTLLIKRLPHFFVEEPKSYAIFVFGITFEFISPVNTMLSVSALPRVTLPVALNVVTVVTPTRTCYVPTPIVPSSSLLTNSYQFAA